RGESCETRQPSVSGWNYRFQCTGGRNFMQLTGYVSVGGARAHRIWFNKAANMACESMAHVFPGEAFEIKEYSRNHREALVRAEDVDEPATYHLVNFATDGAAIVAKSYRQLTHVKRSKARALD
ncbi:MAG: hypothetical protein ACP5PN_10235, partial [Steroidobacteraceae bacterium]